MNRWQGSLWALVFFTATTWADGWQGRWIDLTHPFSAQAIYWPTADRFEKTTVFDGVTDKGFYYSAFNFRAAEHGGTHVDAPVHFAKGRRGVADIPLEQLIGPGVVIRVADRIGDDRNYQVSVDDLTRWETRHGRLPEGAIVLIDSGSAQFWPDSQRYMGTAERGEAAVAKLTFPGIHPELARFLIEERQIRAVGIDTPSIDYGASTLFETHRILFEQNVPGFENVANLDGLPEKGFQVIALPMKIAAGSGAPLRIIAFVPEASGR
ncbi:cyclase family protein [Ferrimonas balearica]|uniref:cyclase family protein n=1 Tax=Ferrimonas balearica TaxID=44012 RepID=UPI001C572499|nr:cyclase family protein [Ferrimonas balearica]MBW3138651.1 cyclase family protein [Ferrimonas balearica]MBY6105712.1 cyclase family protein [Ferrimonas balearica]